MALKFREALARLSRKSYDLEAAPPADVLDCALGCNSMGAPPRVVEAGRGFDYSRLHLTPETSYSKLKKAIVDFWSERADLTTDNVKVANGSIVLMSRLNKLFIENGARVLGYAPQFPEYPAEVMVLGGVYEAVDLEAANNLKFDPQAFISRLDPGQTMAYLDNPNNPSGQLIDLGDIEAIVRAAQEKDILVIVDEAYGDYISEDHSAVNLLDRYDNLTVTRTFSKVHPPGQTSCPGGQGPAGGRTQGPGFDRPRDPSRLPHISGRLSPARRRPPPKVAGQVHFDHRRPGLCPP